MNGKRQRGYTAAVEQSLATESSGHVPALDYLRGLAASAVCIFHFTNGNHLFLPPEDPARCIGSWGHFGVEVFFVISGFVIPYSLLRREFSPAVAFNFLIRRLKRLEPPYLACIVFVLFLNVISRSIMTSVAAAAPTMSAPQLLAHIGYANALMGYEWLNPVFWTLAIEFQFYLFIATVFWAIANPNSILRFCATPLFACIGMLAAGNRSLLPHWLPLFSLGIVVAQFFRGGVTRSGLLACLAISGAAAYFACGKPAALVGVGAAITILCVGYRTPPRLFWPLHMLGVISYSLYLVHVPIGMRVINLACRMPHNICLRYLAIGVAFCASVAVAVVYYKCVELPAARWSRVTSTR